MNSNAYLVDGLRTPIGRFGGSLAQIRVDDLAAHVIRSLVERHSGIESAIDDVILGCANQAGEDNRNLARMALLLAGLPHTVPGETVNRLCASGMSAVISAARAIKVGEGNLFVAGGAESMTRAPYVLSKSESAFARNVELFDTSIGWRFPNPKLVELFGIDGMGQTAENVAAEFGVNRVDQDRFALNSQLKASRARGAGRFALEVVPVDVPKGRRDWQSFSEDEFIRPDTTVEALAALKPAFRLDGHGTVTAGNSSGINDGACALLVASERAVDAYGLSKRARVLASSVVGVEPRIMGIGPVEASKKALARSGLKLSDIDVIELNEAFASQSLACLRLLGLDDDDPRVNPNGGAIALGHPLGMSGARLLHTAMIELEQQDARFALCTMCVGVGQGMAAIIERVD
ncbi:MAG: 3-oxoadipyl-CoA thiolase [Bacteroidetes bacterium]|nr:3-oxoadipyl-CoA thiolase [Bacteroidota bacterium]